MQNRATCKAIWLSLFCMPEVSKTLQHGLQHNVTFFWICVMIIWIIQKTLRKKLGRLHQRPVEDLIVAAAEQQSQINLPKTMKFGSQTHLVCKTTSHPTQSAHDDMPPVHSSSDCCIAGNLVMWCPKRSCYYYLRKVSAYGICQPQSRKTKQAERCWQLRK